MYIKPIDTPENYDGLTIEGESQEVINGEVMDALPKEALPISKLSTTEQFRVLQAHLRADMDHSREWRTDATYWMAFRAGEQWTAEDRAILDNQDRPHIVFNRVLTILKAVAGMEINGRHEISFIPRGTEDTKANELLTAASKWMADSCEGEDEESAAFDHCCTCGMGWVEERMSYEDDPSGLYVEEAIDPREMYWDRTAKKRNVLDARRKARVRRMPFSDAVMIFPGKTRDQLDASWAIEGLGDYPLRSIEERRRRDRDNGDDTYDDQCEVTIVHMQWIEKEVYWIVADERSQKTIELSNADYEKLVGRFRELGMTLKAAKMIRKVYKQAFLGGELLQPASDAPIKGQFSWKCVTGELDEVKRTWFGLVKVMRDPQMWANKWLSQILHILNTTAKGGIIAEVDAFEDQREAEEGYAHPDTITWAAKDALSGPAPKIIPKPGAGLSDGYVGLLTFAVSSIKDVTGINLELLGQQDQNQPGILEAMRKQAGMTVLATLFDSLRRFRKQVGRSRLFFIQNFLSDGRLIRVTGMDDVKAIRLAREKTTGTYDVVVDDTPTSPNQKEQNWAIIQPLLAVFKDQLVANPEIFAMLLEFSPLPSRIVEAIKAMIAKQAEDPQKQQEQQENRQLLLATAAAEIEKNKSIAAKNLAGVEGAKADALQSMAMARNMLEDNSRQERMGELEAIEAEANATKAQADAILARIKAEREQRGMVLDERGAQNDGLKVQSDAASKRVAQMIDMLSAKSNARIAESTVIKNVAAAKKLVADANRPDPVRATAGAK